jgi:hypothetical protein
MVEFGRYPWVARWALSGLGVGIETYKTWKILSVVASGTCP